MSLSSSIQWLIDFVMRRHYRYPHKVPNPNPVKTDFQGHYATIAHSERKSPLDGYVTKVIGGANLWRPNLVGLQHRIWWRDLEPSKGVYDFSLVEHLLDECTKHNCSGANGKVQMLLMIEDKSFFADDNGYPQYLFDETGPCTGNGTLADPTGGYTSQSCHGLSRPSLVARWDPYVSTRYNLLIKALSEFRSANGGVAPSGFDLHPNFEGIVIQESSLGLDATSIDSTYSADKYETGIKSWITSINNYFPKSRALWMMNFIQGGQAKMDSICAWMTTNIDGGNFGGPDCLHDRASLNNSTGAYQYYEKYKSSLDAFASMQNDSFREVKTTGPTVYYTMQEQFDLARGGFGEETTTPTPTGWQLSADRVLFDFRPTPTDTPQSFDWSDAAAVIDAHPEFNKRSVKKF